GVSFGKPFAALVPLAPRTVSTIGTGLAVAGLVGTLFYVRADPMEYDVSKLRNDLSARATEGNVTAQAEEVTGFVGAAGMAILVDRVDQVAPLREALYRRRDAA